MKDYSLLLSVLLLFCFLPRPSLASFLMNPDLIAQLARQSINDTCANKVLNVVNDPSDGNTFNTLFVSSGKSINDLGNYEMCQNYRDARG